MGKVLTPGSAFEVRVSLIRLDGDVLDHERGTTNITEIYEDTEHQLFYGVKNGEVYALIGHREGAHSWLAQDRQLRDLLGM